MEISEGIKWIVGTLVVVAGSIGSLFGISKLVELRTLRKFSRQDRQSEIHETNAAKEIDADIIFKKSFIDRLEKVESKLDEVQKELNSQMVKNATLEAENKSLKATNQRQEAEIKELHTENTKQAKELINLKNENARMKSDLDNNRQELRELKIQFERLNKM